MQSNTLWIVTYFRFTVNIATVSRGKFSYLFYQKIHQRGYIHCYFPLTYDDLLIDGMFYIELSCNFFFSQISHLFFCVIFLHSIYAAVKEIYKLWFESTTTSADTKLPLPQHRKHWITENYQGSGDSGGVDIDSDANCMASVNLWQPNTVPSKCERFPWTWTWRLMYFDFWSHFEKCPGII